MAYIGGTFQITKEFFQILLFFCLMISGVLLFLQANQYQLKKQIIKKIPFFMGILIGAGIGLISGIVGIGGGILLSPILFNLKAAQPKHIVVEEGDDVRSGQVLVKIPRVLSKLKDITGGLPRVTELFEARNPSNPAVVCEIDGVTTFGVIKRGNREIIVEAKDGVVRKYLVPLSRQILVQDGDFVKAGAPLSDGQTAPADILAIKGPFAVQEYVVNEIQEVYRLQGVKINDKHVEVIVRQMMREVIDEDLPPGQVDVAAQRVADLHRGGHAGMAVAVGIKDARVVGIAGQGLGGGIFDLDADRRGRGGARDVQFLVHLGHLYRRGDGHDRPSGGVGDRDLQIHIVSHIGMAERHDVPQLPVA